MRDMRRAFGRAPEDFKYSVAGVLQEIRHAEQAAPRRIKLSRRMVLVAAAVGTLLLAGVVYAVVSEYRLANYYQEYYQVDISPEVQEQMAAEAPADTVQVGPLLLRVQEAYLEDRTLYASANISTADGSPAYYIATDIGPEDRVGTFLQEGRGEDDRSYLQAAREDGRKLYYVGFYADIPEAEGGSGSMEYTLLPDGTATFVSTSEVEGLPAGQEKAMAEYMLVVKEVDLDTGEYVEGDFRHSFQEEVSARHSEESGGFDVGKMFANSAVQLDEIVFRKMALGTDCLMYCSNVEGAEGVRLSPDADYWLTLVDETGDYLPNGAGDDNWELLDDGRVLITRSIRDEQVPASGGTLYIKLYNVMNKDTVDIMEVKAP